MAEREIKRNGRGQIVSYEIVGVNDPTIATQEYGKFLLQNVGEDGTFVEKYNTTSFVQEINTDITTELILPNETIATQIVLNEIITITDKRGVESVDPIGFAGTFIGQQETLQQFDSNGNVVQERTYVWDGTKWE
jgi:hypothetical protein